MKFARTRVPGPDGDVARLVVVDTDGDRIIDLARIRAFFTPLLDVLPALSLAFVLWYGGVAVIHHNQCGTGALADDGFRHRYAERIGADESTLREHAVLDPVATVAHDVALLRTAPAISSRVTVSGHVYDVVTGLVETVLS